MRKLGVLFGAVLTLSASLNGQGPVDLAALSRGADEVVVASVTRVEPVFQVNEFGDKLIVSKTHLRVESSLKRGRSGVSESSEIVMDLEGGTIGTLTLSVSDLPVLSTGERAVVFLKKTDRGAITPHERGQGILKLDALNRVRGTDLTLTDVKDAVGRAK